MFEVNEKTGTGELKEVIDFSGDLKIENSNSGSINIYEDENKKIDLNSKNYNDAYKIVE